MTYKLKKRTVKQFELYNDLAAGDMVELEFHLRAGEGPRRGGKAIKTERLWVELKEVRLESNDIYRAILKEGPRYLKHLRKGDTLVFSPESVLRAKRKKNVKKIKDPRDFAYAGKKKKKECFKNILYDGRYSYAIDPSIIVLRTSERFERAVSIEKLDDNNRKEFDNIAARFSEVEIDKYNVKVNTEFIKKGVQKIRAKTKQETLSTSSVLIRVSDRTYVSFNLINKILALTKQMLIYLKGYEDYPMLYFKNEKYDGFLCLATKNSDSIILDIIEK